MCAKRMLSVFLAGILLAGQLTVPVLAKSSGELQQELDQFEEELSDSRTQSEALTSQITDLQKEVGSLTSDLEALNIEMQEYRDGMTLRIKYFYEEQPADSILSVLLGAKSFSDMLSQLEYLQSLYEYDADQLDQYSQLIDRSKEKKTELNDNIKEMSALLEEQETLQGELESAISGKEGELAQAEAEEAAAREEQARAEAEAAAREEAEKEAEKETDEKEETEELEEAAKTTVSTASSDPGDSSDSEKSSSSDSEKSSSSESSKSSTSGSSGSSSSGSSKGSSSGSSSGLVSYNGNVAKISMYPNDSGGVLTRSKGVVYYNGHKETWYSQKVLPGGGLHIPGRHVDENGLIRDGDGYICVASSDLPKGTLIETSLGMAKVYDSGCASGTIDIYTDW